MIEFTGYHGTSKNSCDSILASGSWIPSQGTRHWLGDGIYFFGTEKDAVSWTIMFKGKGTVLEADISVEKDKMLDLDSEAHLQLFKEQVSLILENADKYDLKIDNKNKIDGFVLNFIYNKIYQYHIAKRKFYFRMKEFDQYREKYGTTVSRFMQEQLQYSVRESDCIVQAREKRIV